MCAIGLSQPPARPRHSDAVFHVCHGEIRSSTGVNMSTTHPGWPGEVMRVIPSICLQGLAAYNPMMQYRRHRHDQQRCSFMYYCMR